MKKLIYILLPLAVIFLTVSQLNAQVEVHGIVKNDAGEVLPGVTVLEKGTVNGVITNIDGEYRITCRSDSSTLVFSYIGFIQEELAVKRIKDADVILQEELVGLDEIVVVGYGTMKRRGRSSRASSVLSGRTSGVYITSADDGPSYEADIAVNHSERAGILTAGEINDFGKWKLWKDIAANDLNMYAKSWGMFPRDRYSVMLKTQDGFAIPNAKVRLLQGNSLIWQGRSDNTGTAELWAGYSSADSSKMGSLRIEVEYNGMVFDVKKARAFHKGMNMVTLQETCLTRNVIDIAFVVDATGSMGDEINYLKAELDDIMGRLKDTLPQNQINLGSVFYRDEGDEYVTKMSDLSSDFSKAITFVRNNYADGGGDGPEAVEQALDVAINHMNWDDNAISRVVFLILDAPPHQNIEVVEKLKKVSEDAARKGIRIVPVTCSGIDKSTEYLMRTLALLTNGTYVFLTDDSGVGNPHIKPTTDKYDVELFNDLIQRLIVQYSTVVDCMADPVEMAQDTVLIDVTNEALAADSSATEEPVKTGEENINEDPEQIVNQQPTWKCYPNPTTGIITIESDMEINTVYVCDVTGKIVKRHLGNGTHQTSLDISDYRRGIYFLAYEYEQDKWMKGKIILTR